MKKFTIASIVCTAGLTFASMALADTLEMKDGRLLDGKYMGGTQNSVRFQTDEKVLVVPVSDILALTFSQVGETSSSSRQQTSQVAKPPTPQPTPMAATGQMIIQPGTKLAVRMLDELDYANSQEKEWFKGELDTDLRVNGNVVIPRGTRVNGQIVTVKQDRSGSTMAITLRELVVDDNPVSVTTQSYVVRENVKNALDLGIATLKVMPRDRMKAIPYRSLIEFQTSEPLKITVK